jgi:FlaA1/EpsC-like NDP-sugar epimerase
VLEMGQPVKIVDLARRLTELAGLTVRDEHNPDGDIEFNYIGLRPGEKLYEELLIGDNPMPTLHPRIMKANEEYMPWPDLQKQLEEIYQAAEAEDLTAIRTVLLTCVNGYHEPAH